MNWKKIWNLNCNFAKWKFLKNLNNLNENPSVIFTPQSDSTIVVNSNVVILSSNTGQIIYTLDGTDPNLDNGIIYTESITITKEIIIKAISYSYGGKTSSVISGKYAPEVDLKTYLYPANFGKIIWEGTCSPISVNTPYGQLWYLS